MHFLMCEAVIVLSLFLLFGLRCLLLLAAAGISVCGPSSIGEGEGGVWWFALVCFAPGGGWIPFLRARGRGPAQMGQSIT